MHKIVTVILGLVLSTQVFALTDEEVNACRPNDAILMRIQTKVDKIRTHFDSSVNKKISNKIDYIGLSAKSCEELIGNLETTINQLETAVEQIDTIVEIK